MSLALDPVWLTPIGTTGWFVMLLTKALIQKSVGLVVMILAFSMGIIDFWAVAPLHLREQSSTLSFILFWGLALVPWIISAVLVSAWRRKLADLH
mgnify:CR=1 FL=1